MARVGSFEGRQLGAYGATPNDQHPSDNNITESAANKAKDSAAAKAAQLAEDKANATTRYDRTSYTHTTNPKYKPGS